MKTTLAATISVLGVAAAGASAFALNTAVLDSTKPLPSPVPSVVVPATTSAPVVDLEVRPGSPGSTTYEVGEAGIVVVDVIDGVPVVVTVAPAAGWQAVVSPASPGSLELEVVFTGPGTKVVFAATSVAGELTVDVSATPLNTSTPSPGTAQDDDHDDDHDDDRDEAEHRNEDEDQHEDEDEDQHEDDD